MEKTLYQRFMEFIEYKGTNKYSFEKKCGLSTGYLNHIKNNPSPQKIKSISKAYPDLNIDWLLTGEGEMLNQPCQIGIVESQNNKGTINNQCKEITSTEDLKEIVNALCNNYQISLDKILANNKEIILEILKNRK